MIAVGGALTRLPTAIMCDPFRVKEKTAGAVLAQ